MILPTLGAAGPDSTNGETLQYFEPHATCEVLRGVHFELRAAHQAIAPPQKPIEERGDGCLLKKAPAVFFFRSRGSSPSQSFKLFNF